MSARQSKAARRVPNYMPKVLALARALGARRGSVAFLRIVHDADCLHWVGLGCDCRPDVSVERYLPPVGVN